MRTPELNQVFNNNFYFRIIINLNPVTVAIGSNLGKHGQLVEYQYPVSAISWNS